MRRKSQTIEVDSRTYKRLKRIAHILGADDQQDTMVMLCRLTEFLERQMDNDGSVVIKTKHDNRMKKLVLSQPKRTQYMDKLFAKSRKTQAKAGGETKKT